MTTVLNKIMETIYRWISEKFSQMSIFAGQQFHVFDKGPAAVAMCGTKPFCCI